MTKTGTIIADDKDLPIAYIKRTRDYYLGLGYNNPYEWACFDNVPFTKLAKPVSEARIAAVVTAAATIIWSGCFALSRNSEGLKPEVEEVIIASSRQ